MAPFLTFVRQNAHWLGAGATMMFLSSFGQTFFISIFAGEIRAEFGLSNGQWGAIYTAGTTASAVVMIWAGTLSDRFRVRSLGALVLVGLVLTCLTMSIARSAPVLIALIFLLRFLGQGMTSHLAVVAMARWFVATRGRALSVASLGIAAGEALLPLSFVALMTAGIGWRMLWVIAAVIITLAIPLVVLLLRRERTPQSMAGENPSPGMGGRHWKRMEVLRHWLFWMAVPVFLGPAAFGTSLFFHQVHLTQTKGWEHLGFVALLPAFIAMAMASMLLSGWLVDRLGTGRLMPFYLLPGATGFLIIGMADSLWIAGAGLLLLGLTNGANATLSSAFWAEYYGTRYLGAVKSTSVAVMVFGTAVGPGATGLLIDLGIDFEDQTIGVAVFQVLASLLVWLGLSWARPLLPTASQVDVIRT